MPKVPSSNVVPLQAPDQPSGPPPSPTDFAMAAAMMHSEGRLFTTGSFYMSRASGEATKGEPQEVSDLALKGKVAPYTSQYNNKTGFKGPLNITPDSIPAVR